MDNNIIKINEDSLYRDIKDIVHKISRTRSTRC